jgi:NADH:ubiquinone oxidoreductase subunit 5 (subunit L)/multisubunit Na+/H+ antiporter MnhA subunit
MKAMIVNRIGDVGVVVGILLCYDYFGTVDHSVILTIATPTEGK